MEYRKLSTLKKLNGNPRIIRDKQFKNLVSSILENPGFFEARPLILSDRTGELVIIAGNQRYEAAKAAGLKEAPTYLMQGLTEEKEREITIRDNTQQGEWDMDLLSASWADLPLTDWGVDLPEDWLNPPDDTEESISQDDARKTLAERFVVPPFSVLDARQGYWQERKRAWVALGIKSELGRGGAIDDSGASDNGKLKFLSEPGGSARPACDYSKKQRGDGHGRPIMGKNARCFGQDLMKGENEKIRCNKRLSNAIRSRETRERE